MSHAGWGEKRFQRQNECGHPEKRHYANGLCRECYHLTDENKAKRRAYYQSHKDLYRQQTLRRRAERRAQVKAYGLSAETLHAMHEQQGGRCAICRQPPKRKRLALDHDHATGKARAFLCHPCNNALGLFRDNPALLRKAIAYLRAH